MNRHVVIGLIIIGLVALFLFSDDEQTITSPFSFIGEEGYEPYDLLLSTGAKNSEQWSIQTWGDTHLQAGTSFQPICTSGSCYGTSCTGSQTTITANSNGLLGVEYGNARIAAKNLYLNNFKTRFWLQSSPACYSSDYYGSSQSCIGTSKGWEHCAPNTERSWSYETGSLELLWDDYDTGHYQLKYNGLLVEEGTIGEGENYEIYVRSKQACTGTNIPRCTTSSAGFIEPRYQQVFGCDPASGEYVISRTFLPYQDFNIDNLRGFERFCVQIPAIHAFEGVFGTSKQVYYALASGETVPVGSDEAWKVFYIGNAEAAVGLPPDECVGQAYDYLKGECTGLTGFIDICPDGQTYNDGVCVVQVRNLIDYDLSELVGSDSVLLYFSDQNPVIHNHGKAFFTHKTPSYTGVGAGSDGVADYPDGGADAWTFILNNVEYGKGESKLLNQFFRAKLQSIEATAYTETGTASGGTYTYERHLGYRCIVQDIIIIGDEEVPGIPSWVVVDSFGKEELMDIHDLVTCQARTETVTAPLPTEQATFWQTGYLVSVEEPLVTLSADFNTHYFSQGVTEQYAVNIQNHYGTALTGILAVVYQDAIGKTYEYVLVDVPISGKTVTLTKQNTRAGGLKATFVFTLPLQTYALHASEPLVQQSKDKEPVCVPDWECTSWQACYGGVTERLCVDRNICGTAIGKPLTTSTCQDDLPPPQEEEAPVWLWWVVGAAILLLLTAMFINRKK